MKATFEFYYDKNGVLCMSIVDDEHPMKEAICRKEYTGTNRGLHNFYLSVKTEIEEGKK